MKQYKKKEIIQVIKTLQDANDAVGKLNDGIEPAVELLVHCQEAAVNIGGYLESLGDLGISSVRILEDYCENLYRLGLALPYSGQSSRLHKEIRRQLTQLSNEIQFRLPDDKLEVVFLPYKASMWDSLESIWRAAAADEGCEAYVIPIPYFDRNPDGTLSQMHYEGDKYPGNIPITSWEKYSLQERRPDVIYIHNPYDAQNYVTSVHPAFYAKELKKYTDMLVYVPYFVCTDDNVEEHFCTLPGVLYSDRVIVQSEKVRRTYVEVFQRFEKENHCKHVFGDIEKKVLALGSPKYDKLSGTRKADLDIPSEWKNLIVRTNQTSRRVILYNTSLSALLADSEKMIAKIEHVLEIFRNLREQVVLLWRPHPLIPATLQSMRPRLWEHYQKLVTQYKSEGWGIYDDSSDLDRAIVLSDAYYGDGGSLLELYKKTGKMIMVQNADVIDR